jgi:hypothetical protein
MDTVQNWLQTFGLINSFLGYLMILFQLQGYIASNEMGRSPWTMRMRIWKEKVVAYFNVLDRCFRTCVCI